MMRKTLVAIPLLAAMLALSGCGRLFDVNLFFVGEQTSLERQVLGTYSALGEDLLVYSSVRGVQPDGSLRASPETTESQRRAFNAMRNRDYNRDDIERLLAAGFVGEDNRGMLRTQSPDDPNALPSLTANQVEQLVREENNDRQLILARLLETSPAVTDEEIPQVMWIFATLNQDAAPEGSWVQDRSGNWRQK